MKNPALLLHALWAIAFGVLLYLHLSFKREVVEQQQALGKAAAAGAGIVYVNFDTLITKYTYYNDLKGEMESKRSRLEADLQARAQSFQQDVQLYQQQGQTMTDQQRAATEQKLGERQQALRAYSEQQQSKLAEEEGRRTEEFQKRIAAYLKSHNTHGQLQFVLAQGRGSNLLFGNDSLNITREVLNGLNQEYEASKKKK